jgi:hypothetical protein
MDEIDNDLTVRCTEPQFREGYVRGYTDATNEILKIFESAFAGTMFLQIARERVAEKMEEIADIVETIEQSGVDP